ncbi:hypothetical protein LTR85_007787 [Meristemomyces frigidus]|nr:hypothetical protein LTR85_007787 [Meristemomyces frigidus]
MAAVNPRADRTMPDVNRNGQVVTVTVAFELTCIFLCLFTRLYMRWPWRKLLSRNDYMAIIATLFAVCNAVAVSVAVQTGLGRKSSELTDGHLKKIREAVLVAQLFFHLCAAFASIAVVDFLIQIKGAVRLKLLGTLRVNTCVWGLTGTVVMVVFLALRPSVVKAPAFIALGVVGCLISLGTFIVAVMVTLPLQTKRSTKVQVLMGFSPSFVVIAVFIISMVVLPHKPVSNDFTIGIIHFQISSQLILLFLTVYSTAAPLFQMGRRFQTGYNAPIIDEHHTMSGSGSRTQKLGSNNAYDLTSITASKLSKQQYHSSVSASDHLQHRQQERIRRERSEQQEITDGDRESMASDSSQKIIIRKLLNNTPVRCECVGSDGTITNVRKKTAAGPGRRLTSA